MWRNYGRHDKNCAGPQFDIPEITIETVYHPPRDDGVFDSESAYYWFEVDDRRECVGGEEGYDVERLRGRVEVLLSDIIRPERRRRKGEDLGL